MKEILNHLFEHKTLTSDEAKKVLKNIAAAHYNNSQIAAFLSVYLMRSITVEELTGFRDALLDLRVPVDLGTYDTIDLCGTGGDGKDTFNISTLASFVVAGAGGKVAKHGNYGVSSVCGSSNILEKLGYKFSTDNEKLKTEIESCGFSFMHAPLFNPAMKNVAPVRKELGMKTFINMLGPMINPALPNFQMVGVYSLELSRIYNYLYQKTNKQFIILHSLDGYDEVSLTGDCKIIINGTEHMLSPASLGFNKYAPAELKGGLNADESLKIFLAVLEGSGSEAQNDVVVANAGLAIKCMSPGLSIPDCMAKAEESLISGRAMEKLRKLINLQK
jgi:anthranilate phosphoribosyltransferase